MVHYHYMRDVLLYVINIYMKVWKKITITGHDLRPDLFLSLSNTSLYILELTVGYESNLRSNAKNKNGKYRELVQQLKTIMRKLIS